MYFMFHFQLTLSFYNIEKRGFLIPASRNDTVFLISLHKNIHGLSFLLGVDGVAIGWISRGDTALLISID